MTITPAIRRHFARMVKVKRNTDVLGPRWEIWQGKPRHRHFVAAFRTPEEAKAHQAKRIAAALRGFSSSVNCLRARGFKVTFAP